MFRCEASLRFLLAKLSNRLGRDDGATAVEYSLIIVLIAAVIAAVVAALGQQVIAALQSVVGKF